jgi:hypothetical protein
LIIQRLGRTFCTAVLRRVTPVVTRTEVNR